MFEKIKAAVFDIDGTLLNDDTLMMPLTKEALITLHNQGCLLGLASGRRVDQMSNSRERWQLPFDFDFMIGLNGGELFIRESSDYESFYPLSCEQVHACYEAVKDFDTNFYTYQPEGSLYLRMDALTEESMRRFKAKSIEIAKNVEELWERPSPKVLMRCTYEESVKIEAYIREHPLEGIRLVRTQPNVLEMMDARLDKGKALLRFAQKQGFSTDEIIACGDTSNDNEMLEAVTNSVCLLNGSDDTKACARFITDYTNNEDGLGRWFRDHFFPDLDNNN